MPDFDVSRRALLTAAALSTTASAIMAKAAAPRLASSKGESRYDTIVIGAGFAGIAAARELSQAGQRVLVVEARDRIGGRTFTSRFAEADDVDFGGTWIHWSQSHTWAEVTRYAIPIVETPGATADTILYMDQSGHRQQASLTNIFPDLDKAMLAFLGDARTLLPQPYAPNSNPQFAALAGIDSQQRIDQLQADPAIKDMVAGIIAVFGCATPSDTAWLEWVRWFALTGYTTLGMFDMARFRIDGGTRRLIDAMAKDVRGDIRLDTPVTRVRQTADGVEVHTAAGATLTAAHVIATVPMNILNDIRWEPALSAGKRTASAQRHAGVGTKVHVLIKGERDPLICLRAGKVPLNWLFSEHSGDGKTHLVGFNTDRALLKVDDVAAVQRAVRAFIPDAEVLETGSHPWMDDPWSKGGWCTLRPNQFQYLPDLQASSGRISFASADWAVGWRGFIDGAIEQGIKAARGVLNGQTVA